MPSSAPWPPGWPRPRHLRAVAKRRADGATDWLWYCRLSGTRLPDPMTDPAAFIGAVLMAREAAPKHVAGTVGAALTAWRISPEYRGLARRTRDNRDRYTRPLDALADKPLDWLRRGRLLELRDAIAAGPGPAAADMFVQSVSSFLRWCVHRERLEYNPLRDTPRLADGHFEAWTEAEAQHAIATFPEPERRAVILAYHTGQRRGDLIAMAWTNVAGGRIRLVQEKTRKPLVVPLHPVLEAELGRWERTAATILVGPSGRPWTRENLSNRIKAATEAAGLRPGLNLHGIRKLAGARLAEAGATAHEIMALLGHDTLRQAELYTRSAEQERLASAAVVRLSMVLSTRRKGDASA